MGLALAPKANAAASLCWHLSAGSCACLPTSVPFLSASGAPRRASTHRAGCAANTPRRRAVAAVRALLYHVRGGHAVGRLLLRGSGCGPGGNGGLLRYTAKG